MEREPPTDLIEALLDLADVAAQILAHMARWQCHSAPDAPPPGDVFRTLLSETLRPLLERRAPEAIEAAREVLVEAVELIEAEILLVEPPHGARGGRVGLRPPRRPC
jgi:coenzyme F420-reducing hydrogenase alpha subunit